MKEFLALCSALKLYSLQFKEVPVTPPGGNVKYYALWRMELSVHGDCTNNGDLGGNGMRGHVAKLCTQPVIIR